MRTLTTNGLQTRGMYLSADEGGGGSGISPTTNTTETQSVETPTKTFTQEDVQAIASREKDQGKRAALDEMQRVLGVTVEEAKAIIDEAGKRTDADKTEAQRARDAADKERGEAESAKAEAVRERHEAQIERALVKAGVTDEAKISRMARLVEVDTGADAETVKAAVADLRRERPELFTTTAPVPNSDPSGKPPRQRNNDESAMARGVKRGLSSSTPGTGIGGYDLPAQ